MTVESNGVSTRVVASIPLTEGNCLCGHRDRPNRFSLSALKFGQTILECVARITSNDFSGSCVNPAFGYAQKSENA
jgi:hypothetical protein